MKRAVVVAVLAMACFAVGADGPYVGPYVHERSTSPGAARFELVESGLMAGLLFKLDRFNGTVWQSVVDTEGTTGWEELPVEVRSPKNDATPHYQIFMSSHVARHSFLLDTATGKTWVYVAQTEGPALWVPVPQFDTTPQVTFWKDLDAPAAKRKTAK